MKPSPAENQFPPWPNAKVDPASYTTIPAKKIHRARLLAARAITCLITDSYGIARDPSDNERWAIELLHRIQEELRT